MQKTFIFDIDGTLFSSEWKILPESIEALKEIVNQGHQFILASGRPVDSLKTICKTLPVKPLFLIGSNGSATYDFVNKKIYRERKVPQAFIDTLMSNEGVAKEKIIFQKPDITFCHNLEAEHYEHLQNFSLGSTTDISAKAISNLDGASMVGLMGWNDSAWPKYKDFVMQTVDKYNLEIINMKKYGFIDIFPGNSSKGQTLSWLFIEGIINRENCYAFGDGQNDIEMFKFAKYSYSMGQASDDVKANAKFVIGTNDEPSIANTVLEILKN